MNRKAWSPRINIMILVLLCMGTLILVFGWDWYNINVKHAKESVLKNDLQTMRMAIDKYTIDRQHPPQSLQVLVDEQYLRMIPTNPITRKVDWVLHYVNVDLRGEKSLEFIDDVHVSPGQSNSNGVPYSDW